MAEDLLGGVLGSEDEQPETEASQAAAGAEAFAMAVTARLSASDPEVALETVAYLKKQTRLLDLQARHLEDEHTSRLTHLRLTVGAAKRKRYADLIRNTLYTGIALLLLGVLIAASRMTYEALNDHGLVAGNFTVPADFAARGVTGQALAEDLASRMAAIRATALHGSITSASDVRADQAGTLKVQIPETGISIDELERFLHRWLGHQTVVDGELSEEAGGQVSLVLHIAGADPIVVEGPGTDLRSLVQAAAEKAFGVFDPDNAIIYLGVTGRIAEAYDAAVRNAHSASPAELSSQGKAGAYALLAAIDPDTRRAIADALIETDINPHELVGWDQAAAHSADLGHDQAAFDFYRKGLQLGSRKQDQPLAERDSYALIHAEALSNINQYMGDFTTLPAYYDARDSQYAIPLAARYAHRAQAEALLHDEAAARQDLAFALAAGAGDGTEGHARLGSSPVLQTRWDVSSAAGDWPQALEAAKALVAAREAQKSTLQELAPQRPEFPARGELELAVQYRPLLALAEAMTGDTAAATALISQTPTDCYLCVRTRAKIAAAAGDSTTADRWFAEAVRQAPDLPTAYTEWGQALLARGDLAGAARELSLAHDKGPRFADPLKTWGDVLVKQGHPDQALSKYDEALKYAPDWAALKQARETAGNIHHG